MTQSLFGKTYGGSAPENYAEYFVPLIGAPLAADLIEAAALRPDERVLDVACGTGVVTRLAAQRVTGKGSVAGLDLNPGMLAVARSSTPPGVRIDWYETNVEATPLPDGALEVVLCQMGLQFFANKLGALREIRRILAPGGRLVLNVPGPIPPLFEILSDAIVRHVHPQGAIVHIVFSLHDAAELRELMTSAGFRDVDVRTTRKPLRLPPPREFLWQYLHSTPLVGLVVQASDAQRAALEDEVSARWQDLLVDGALVLDLGMTTVIAR